MPRNSRKLLAVKTAGSSEMKLPIRISAAYRDLAVLSVGFLLSYTAYTGTSALQTALHPRHALGSSSLALLYVACVLSVLFVAAPLVARCGPRLALVAGAAALATYTLANLYQPALYPAAVLAGLGLGPLWSAHGAQVALLARWHAERTGEPQETSVTRFFGIFFAVHRCSFVSGCLLSSLVLSASFPLPGSTSVKSLSNVTIFNNSNALIYSSNQNTSIPFEKYSTNFNNSTNSFKFDDSSAFADFNNSTKLSTSSDTFSNSDNSTSSGLSTTTTATCPPDVNQCGSRFCHRIVEADSGSDSGSPVGTAQKYVLFATYGACAVLGAVVLGFLSRATSSPEVVGECRNQYTPNLPMRQALLETLSRMKQPMDVLLLPMAFFSGASYAFFIADFSLAFVACSLGVDQVGYVMASFGVAGALGSVLLGNLVRWTGRIAIFLSGGLLTGATLVGLLLWKPSDEGGVLYLHLFSALWGLANVVWTSQLLALVGFVFRDERNPAAAYACNYLWQMLGSCVWFAAGNALCLAEQIYVLAALLLLGVASYCCLEFLIRSKRWRGLLLRQQLPRPPSCDVMAADISLLGTVECHLDADQLDHYSSTDSIQFSFLREVDHNGDLCWVDGRTSPSLNGDSAMLTFVNNHD